MDMDIIALAKNYKNAQKALAKARKALVAAMDKDAREVSPLKPKKASPPKFKRPSPPSPPKSKKAPAKPKKAPPAKPKKSAPAKSKKQSRSDWAPYRATLIKKMKKGQWITGFDARVFSGHERGPGFTQNVLHYFLNQGVIKKRKVKTTIQWCLK